jgi:hypothetical protein
VVGGRRSACGRRHLSALRLETDRGPSLARLYAVLEISHAKWESGSRLAAFSPLAVDTFERTVLVGFAIAAVIVGVVASIVLAVQLDDRNTIPTSYWESC